MPKRFLIHKTYDSETGDPLQDYYTQNPISEGTMFEVQYEGQTLRFRVDMHFVTDETQSMVELVDIGEPCAVKRPRL